MSVETGTRTAIRTCPLCEAGCGLEVTVTDGAVVRIRGDRADVFSHGFICPKGSTLKQLHDDPDRLRQPLVRRDGKHVEVTWAEAWQQVHAGLNRVIAGHGRDSLASYLGNPGAHSLSVLLYARAVIQALGSRNRFSASTVDQMPKQVSSGYLFGTGLSVPVPDLDRTSYLLILGANPYASNGSLCTAPDFPGRLEAIQARGGKIVVVDPRRSRTAESADEWLAIRPGTDAGLLLGIAQTLFAEGLVDVGSHVGQYLDGLDEVRTACAPFTPEVVEQWCGIDAATIRRIARELASAPTAAVYGRIGTTTTMFGTTASWLVDVVNVLTGNLDRPGGVMFARPVAGNATTRGQRRVGGGFGVGRGHSRVSGHPEVMGEYPVAVLAEEIVTPGPGQIKGLVTIAGNPVLSTPNGNVSGGPRLDEALDQLEFMVSVDIYLNETSRHADVILPPPSPLQRSHYDLALLNFAVRNVANYSPPVLTLEDGQPDEWEILVKLAAIAGGAAADADAGFIDEAMIGALVAAAVRDPSSNVHGRESGDVLAQAGSDGRHGPERLLDFMVRTGPYGDGFGANPGGVTLDQLLVNEHGIDFGPLEPRLPDVLRTPSGLIELAPPVLVDDLQRLRAAIDGEVGHVDGAPVEHGTDGTDGTDGQMVLVGRRDLRSNNSWMHNIAVLVKGKERCTLQLHPDDAGSLGLTNGQMAIVSSSAGTLRVPVDVTDGIRRGVVSLPHGWGHDADGSQLRVAGRLPGVNSNVLSDHRSLDPLSGTSVLTAIPVTVSAAPSAHSARRG
jgi:anaerobic selenocysteine-containing dehydrogenase